MLGGVKLINSIQFENKFPLGKLNLTKKKKQNQHGLCYFQIDKKNLIENI
jgi:hypothetical protein